MQTKTGQISRCANSRDTRGMWQRFLPRKATPKSKDARNNDAQAAHLFLNSCHKLKVAESD